MAPIFDCGSCLYPQIDDTTIEKCLNDKNEFNARVYDFPTSAILKNGKRINYYSFITSHEYKECDKAVERAKKLIKLEEIYKLIDNLTIITNNHKLFLKKIIEARCKEFFK